MTINNILELLDSEIKNTQANAYIERIKVDAKNEGKLETLYLIKNTITSILKNEEESKKQEQNKKEENKNSTKK